MFMGLVRLRTLLPGVDVGYRHILLPLRIQTMVLTRLRIHTMVLTHLGGGAQLPWGPSYPWVGWVGF